MTDQPLALTGYSVKDRSVLEHPSMRFAKGEAFRCRADPTPLRW